MLVTSISSEFDIFMHRHIQTAVLGSVETVYKTLPPVKQYDLEFLYLETPIPTSI